MTAPFEAILKTLTDKDLFSSTRGDEFEVRLGQSDEEGPGYRLVIYFQNRGPHLGYFKDWTDMVRNPAIALYLKLEEINDLYPDMTIGPVFLTNRVVEVHLKP